MSESTAKDQLNQAFNEETNNIIIATKHDMNTLENYAREIIRKKDIPIAQRLTYLKRFLPKLGKAGRTYSDQQLRQILGNQRKILNGSGRALRGGDINKFNPAPFMWHGVVMKNTTTLIVSLPKV